MATITINGANSTLKLEYTAPNAKMVSILGDASHYLFDHGYGNHGTDETPILFDDLTSQQKVNIIDAHIKQVILDMSNTFKSVEAQRVARETEEANKYNL